jgi:hypothetical protein
MNVVVNFLSTLVSDESNGSIKRMLGLCGEFERIAKVVLDKAEKESHSRKKRKNAPEGSAEQGEEDSSSPSAKRTQPPPTSAAFSPSVFTKPTTAHSPGTARSFSGPTMPPGIPTDLPSNVHSMPGLGQGFSDMLSPEHMASVGFPDQPPFSAASPGIAPFQQPFVPQDLWQMPMTIEWDWADMSTNFPPFEGPGPGPGGPGQ